MKNKKNWPYEVLHSYYRQVVNFFLFKRDGKLRRVSAREERAQTYDSINKLMIGIIE